jgi:spore germination protein YaaH
VVAPDRLVLTDTATRGRVLAGARDVLAEGFDGVHYDFEPVADGNAGYLALLRATGELAHGQGRLVSVAAHQVEPLPGLGQPLELAVSPRWWSRAYLAQVGGLVDQIAIMSYDTAMPTQAAYTGYVRRQTEVALRTVPAGTGLLIGLPAYHEGTFTHRGSETVAAAIRGVRLGLGEATPRAGFGVALYIDFTATEADWRDYRRGWVRP